MENESQSDVFGTWGQRNIVENTLAAGYSGPPELKPEEKRYYLGEFKERVIKLLTKKQVSEPIVYPEIVEALKNNKAAKIIINGDISSHHAEKYQNLAKQLHNKYTVVHDPHLKGEAGLIVVSNDAAGVIDINVEDRETRLKKLGISPELINAVGEKICKNCWSKITKVVPEEAGNYQLITLKDRFWGLHCPVCEKH